jgi:hypothetical protein
VQSDPRPPPPLQCCNKFPQRPRKTRRDSPTVSVFALNLLSPWQHCWGNGGPACIYIFPYALNKILFSSAGSFISYSQGTKTFKSVMYRPRDNNRLGHRKEYHVYTGRGYEGRNLYSHWSYSYVYSCYSVLVYYSTSTPMVLEWLNLK